MLTWVLAGFLALLPSHAWAHEDDQDEPRLTVSAEGKMDVRPDKAVLSFAVETVGEKLAKVQQENQERMARVLEEMPTVSDSSPNIFKRHP